MPRYQGTKRRVFDRKTDCPDKKPGNSWFSRKIHSLSSTSGKTESSGDGGDIDDDAAAERPPTLPMLMPSPPPPLPGLLRSATMDPQVMDKKHQDQEQNRGLGWIILEFLKLDERPTFIFEIKPALSLVASLAAEEDLQVDVIFENRAFLRIKSTLNVDLRSSADMGILLRQNQCSSPREWLDPEAKCRFLCVGIDDLSTTRTRRWWRVITVEEISQSTALNIPKFQTDDMLGNFGGGGEGDVRRISIAEEPPEFPEMDQSMNFLRENVTPTAPPSEAAADIVQTSPEDAQDSTMIFPRAIANINTGTSTVASSRRQSIASAALNGAALATGTRRSSRSSSAGASTGSRRSSLSNTSNSTGTTVKYNRPPLRPSLDWTRGLALGRDKMTEDYFKHLRSLPWHETSTGPLATWPNSLRCMANAIMTFPHPTVIHWGIDLTSIYNMEWQKIARARHGRPVDFEYEGCVPLKDYSISLIEKAWEGITTQNVDQILFIDLEVLKQESYFTFTVSPIVGESGAAEGILQQAHARTNEVLQERRMETLRTMRGLLELVSDLDRENFWQLVLNGLEANTNDIPFAMIFKVIDEKYSVLAGALGIPEPVRKELVPHPINIGGNTASSSGRTLSNSSLKTKNSFIIGDTAPACGVDVSVAQSLSTVAEDIVSSTPNSEHSDGDDSFIFFPEMVLAKESNTPIVKDLTTLDSLSKEKMSGIELRGFGDPCVHAVVLPIQPGPAKLHGFLILGLNPRLPYDEEYQRWVSMLMEQLATAVGRARIFTEDLRRALDEARYQKQLTSQAVERKRQQENFIDISSHELRNPLSAVLHSAEGILNSVIGDNEDSDEVNKQLITDSAKTILLCVNHQSRIIEDILTLSKLDSSLMTVVPSSVNVEEVIHNCLLMFVGEFDFKQIEHEFKVMGSYQALKVGMVNIDPSRMTQILVNLVTNAIKFTSRKEGVRKITITLDAYSQLPRSTPEFAYSAISSCDEQIDATLTPEWGTGEIVYISLSVQDTGIGISAMDQAKLFERFNQVPKTYVNYGGSGLGLYISRKLCHLQGGNIGVASEEGIGSKFSFFIKARRQLSNASTPRSVFRRVDSAGSGLAPKIKDKFNVKDYRVLVVEDNIINQKVLRQQLEMEGCVVEVANNGAEALDKLVNSTYLARTEAKEKIDIVLMDMDMPVMDGVAATKRVREWQDDHVPIIGISANVRPEQTLINSHLWVYDFKTAARVESFLTERLSGVTGQT